MQTTINVTVNEELLKEASKVYERIGLRLDEAIRIFLRRSVRVGGLPFPVSSQMAEADKEVQKFLKTGKGLKIFKSQKEAFEALDRL